MSSNAKAAYSKVAAPGKIVEVYSQRWDLFPYLVVVLLLMTAVSLFHVWSRARVIELNLQITEANRLIRDQQQDNGRLRLEVASLKSPARIEGLARGELGMALPTDQQLVMVR